MEDYIPSSGFFTPKRPSFHISPTSHQHMPSNTHGSRTAVYNTSNHHHRRMHSNGNGMFHHAQKSYFADRYGRTPEHSMPVYYTNGYGRYHNHPHRNPLGNYGPFPQGVFTPPPTSIKGNVGKRMSNPQKCGDHRSYEIEDEVSHDDGTESSNTPLTSASSSGSSTVDQQYFADNRPVNNFVAEGQKEYKLFEDREILKDVYNVNDMDCYDPQEICGVKILPKTLKKWPLLVLGTDWGALKKHIINFTGGFGSCGLGSIIYGRRGLSSGEQNWGEVGSYGVGALARFFVDCQGTGEYPLGYITYVGMNLDKVVRDLDNSEPITPAFSGPLADRNQCVEAGWDEVFKGFKEYELPYEADGDPWTRSHEMYEWTLRHRMKRRMLGAFSLEVLIFIFYTITADALQLLAAKEMYHRGWRYHKIFQVWMTPWLPGVCEELEGWTSGVYKFFHYGRWEFCRAEFKINDSVLEGEPQDFVEALWD